VLKQMEQANQVKQVVQYGTNDLEIMIPAANPKNIQSLKDLGRADVALSMPNPAWEGVANQIADSLRKAGGDSLYQAVYQDNLPVAAISTMQDIYSESMARTSFTLVMLAIAGTMALALGILGIYGVISYAVSQRTREIGIRMALGANKSELLWMFVRSALVLTGVGTAVGLGAAAALMRLMRTLLFGISPLDPVTFTAVPVALIAAAALASYLPARRTAAVDPVEALRAE
jgi:ABC-type antimicrobial peptide transport system permease subunit